MILTLEESPMNKSNSPDQSPENLQRSVAHQLRLHFLCPHHRDWVYFNSQKALEHLEQIQLKGELLLEHQRWSKALAQLGSAWEITDILLQLHSGEKNFLVNRLCCLNQLLCQCLLRMGHSDCAQQVRQQSCQILSVVEQQLAPDSENRLYLMQCIDHMKSQLAEPDSVQHYLSMGSLDTISNRLH